MNTNKKTHGGQRPGSGRKLLFNEKMVPVTIRLPQHYLDAIRALGEGNVSRGIRKLFEAHAQTRA